MQYFWRGCRGNLNLITLGSERFSMSWNGCRAFLELHVLAVCTLLICDPPNKIPYCTEYVRLWAPKRCLSYSPWYLGGLFSLNAMSPSILSLVGITCEQIHHSDLQYWTQLQCTVGLAYKQFTVVAARLLQRPAPGTVWASHMKNSKIVLFDKVEYLYRHVQYHSMLPCLISTSYFTGWNLWLQ